MYERNDPNRRNSRHHEELDCELLPDTPAAEGRVGRTYKLLNIENLPLEISEQQLKSGEDVLTIPRALVAGGPCIPFRFLLARASVGGRNERTLPIKITSFIEQLKG